MPVLSMFYGIIIRMFYMDNKQHKYPHIHAEYQDYIGVIDIEKDFNIGSVRKVKNFTSLD